MAVAGLIMIVVMVVSLTVLTGAGLAVTITQANDQQARNSQNRKAHKPFVDVIKEGAVHQATVQKKTQRDEQQCFDRVLEAG